jgi:hypothetical protein
MQRIQLETVNPQFFTDEELAHYVTLYAAGDLPPEWVAELIERFVKLLDAAADHPQN